MNREIKFRAWESYTFDDRTKRMIYDVQNTSEYSVTSCESFGELCSEDDYIVMQFTGLKDKNGKEIYEGDILKHTFADGEIVIAEVYYDTEDAAFELKYKTDVPMFITDEWEVIGNIYENPELLKP